MSDDAIRRLILQAQGRDLAVERQLRASGGTNLEKMFRIVYGRDLSVQERSRADAITAVLNTGPNDEYASTLFLFAECAKMNILIGDCFEETKTAVIEAKASIEKAHAARPVVEPIFVYFAIVLLMTALLADVWTAGKLTIVSDRLDTLEARATSIVRGSARPLPEGMRREDGR